MADDNLLNEVKNIVDKQRELAEKYGADSAEFKKYVENSDVKMAEYDKKNDELVANIAEKQKAIDEQKQRIEHLEKLASYSKQEKKEVNPHDIANALFKNEWVKFANENQEKAQQYVDETVRLIKDVGLEVPAKVKTFTNAILQVKAANDLVRTDIGEFGGYLVPMEWSNTLREQVTEYSQMRRFATVETIMGKSILMPIEKELDGATWEGEAETNTDDVTPTFLTEELTPHRLAKTIPITWDMLNNNAYNVSGRIMNWASKNFAKAEGLAFVRGTGIKQPLGFTVDPIVVAEALDTATNTLEMDDVIKLTGELKQGYNPMYFFNRRTLVYLRTLKDAVNGRYLWAGPFGDAATGSPATINGTPYSASFIEMDDYDVNNGFPILFADMKQFYCITDRTDMVVIRDELTRKKQAIVEFEVMKWTHGQPILREAGKLLKKIP